MKACDNLSEFIELLESEGELLRIGEEISPEIEISKITDAESKKPGGGKALLFTNVVDGGKRKFNVATNLFGSEKRMAMALGVGNLEEAGNRISELIKTRPPKSFSEIFGLAKSALSILKTSPRKWNKKAPPPCQEVVKLGNEIDIGDIPVLKCWPHDGGRFITLPLVFTQSPDGSEKNLGMYRLQVFDKNTTGMHWHIHKDASHHFGEYSKIGKRMPVSVAIGADPATIYAATAPMPRGIYELLLAGFFRGKGVKTAKCITNDIEVPAESEFILEGYVDVDERRLEGPFGDHTGYYSQADMYPIFHLTALTHRRNPTYCATLVGPPPMEDCYMAKATERIFLPMLRMVMPEISNYFLPWEGVFHNICIVSIKKEYPAHAQKLFSGLWGQGQMGFCKAIVAVDADVNPKDLSAIWKLFAEKFDAARDVFLSYGVLDVLDHSSPTPLMGAKIGIDLTTPRKEEPQRKASNLKIADDRRLGEIRNFIREDACFKNCEFLPYFAAFSIEKGEQNGRQILHKLANSKLFDGYFRAAIIFDADIDISNKSKMLWKVFNNTDPSRDIIFSESNCAFVDACKKNSADGYLREWPDDLSFDK